MHRRADTSAALPEATVPAARFVPHVRVARRSTTTATIAKTVRLEREAMQAAVWCVLPVQPQARQRHVLPHARHVPMEPSPPAICNRVAAVVLATTTTEPVHCACRVLQAHTRLVVRRRAQHVLQEHTRKMLPLVALRAVPTPIAPIQLAVVRRARVPTTLIHSAIPTKLRLVCRERERARSNRLIYRQRLVVIGIAQ
jgi:hypothetical protein